MWGRVREGRVRSSPGDVCFQAACEHEGWKEERTVLKCKSRRAGSKSQDIVMEGRNGVRG
jgi:hypothetical protein